MKLSEETTRELLAHALGLNTANKLPFELGEKYYIRTVTHHHTGRVKKMRGNFVCLEDAAWIGNSGRFTQAIELGELDEVEPVTCEVWVNAESIIDVYKWRHALPRVQK